MVVIDCSVKLVEWIRLYKGNPPYTKFVYSGERADIEGEYIINMLECYLGILIASLVWTMPILFIVFTFFKFFIKESGYY